jgi:hypothetical protein
MENKKASLIEIRRKMDSIRGTIVSSASRIEFILGYRLRRYFYPKTNEKATILFWKVINTSYLSFDSKISIYESIPYFKKLKCYSKAKTSLRFIQRLRNIMAHWELNEKESDLENIVLYTFTPKYKKITVTNSLVEEYKKHEKFLLKEFGYSR